MKKITGILLVLVLALSAVAFTGCGCSKDKDNSNKEIETITTAVVPATVVESDNDKIRFYSGANDKKGSILQTVTGKATKSMKIIDQVYSDAKSKKLKEKENVDNAVEIYYVEVLRYGNSNTVKSTESFFLYLLDDGKVYCYNSDKQKFDDGEYYICGYTNVDQDTLNGIITGEIQ